MAKSSSFTAQFDEATFRSAVLNTMLMGMPQDAAQQLTWCWSRDRTYVPDDPAGQPYDFSAPAVTNTPGNPALPDTGADQELVVPYALEFSARPAGSVTTVFGEIDTSQATVTLMDTDYQKVATADYARIGDSHYRIKFDAPPQGLFGVTVWTVYLEAEDEA